MIFFVGLIFTLIGLVMLVKYFINRGRPKVDAKVLGLLKEAAPGQFIEQPHALVEYEYLNTKYTTKVLLATKPQVGDTIKIAVKPELPTKAVEYHPKKEILVVLVMGIMGIGIMAASVVLTTLFFGE